MGKATLLLIWLAADPAVVRHYPTFEACEKVLAEALKDPGADGFCFHNPTPPTNSVPDFLDGLRTLAGR